MLQLTRKLYGSNSKRWIVLDDGEARDLTANIHRINYVLAGYDRMLKERNALEVQLKVATDLIQEMTVLK